MDDDVSLAEAVAMDDVAAVKRLLQRGADPDERSKNGVTHLMTAAIMGQAEVARALIHGGADVDARDDDLGSTVLFRAASMGHEEIVRALIDGGADVNARDRQGHTVLMTAALYDQAEVVEALIRAGADVNGSQSDDGWTALSVAVRSGHKRVFEVLREAGARR